MHFQIAMSLLSLTNALNLPLSTSGHNLVDSTGRPVVFAGVNWPGHMEAMIPEGLQHRSVEQIVSTIRSLGMNVVRLTYATQMTDELLAGRGDVRTGFVRALGEQRGGQMWSRIMQKNGWREGMTRMQVYDAVAAELNRQGIMIHLDNHISQAEWCCGTRDGNSWFGDKYFDTEKWIQGWKFMANHTRRWRALSSHGLRNELRSPDSNENLKKTYNWNTWTQHMRRAAQTIHAENPAAVIFLSGLGYDTDLSVVSSNSFRMSDWPPRKTALELHQYDNKQHPNSNDCSGLYSSLDKNGWNVMRPNHQNSMPVIMTEFGFAQDDKAYKSGYAQCLKTFFAERRAGWMYWVLSGSYYKRSGKEDFDEPWGILNHDWSGWRSAETVERYLRSLPR